MPITLTSPAFPDGDQIPERHTCDGADLSPPLAWSGVPDGTRSLALVCEDPDAPRGTWTHWLLYRIPPDVRALPEWVPTRPELDDGSRQGTNDFGAVGYGGPCPPSGTHRYVFTLYALDAVPDLPPGASKADFDAAIEGHVLDAGRLTGTGTR